MVAPTWWLMRRSCTAWEKTKSYLDGNTKYLGKPFMILYKYNATESLTTFIWNKVMKTDHTVQTNNTVWNIDRVYIAYISIMQKTGYAKQKYIVFLIQLNFIRTKK